MRHGLRRPRRRRQQHVPGRIVDGWLKPDGQADGCGRRGRRAGVDFRTAIAGMVIPAEGEPFAQTIAGSKQGAVAGRIVGSSQAACEGFSVTRLSRRVSSLESLGCP